jgi:hypothetical protein
MEATQARVQFERRRIALGSKPNRVLGLCAVAVALFMVTPVSALAGDHVSFATDVSDTAMGRSLIDDSAGRFAALGVSARDLHVWRDAGGYLVAEVDTQFDHRSVTVAGRAEELLVPTTFAFPPAQLDSDGSTMSIDAAASWSTVASACFNRYSDGYSYLDHCYTMYKLTSDGSNSYDWFALQRKGTAGPLSIWVINSAIIDAKASASGSAQSWADWDPNYDYNGPCRSVTVSVSFIVALSMPVQQCERVSFTKSNPAVNYTQTWSGRQAQEVTVGWGSRSSPESLRADGRFGQWEESPMAVRSSFIDGWCGGRTRGAAALPASPTLIE